jgi:hypothetical protein
MNAGAFGDATLRQRLKRLMRIGVVSYGPIRMARLSEELVADAMYGDDVLRLSRGLFDLLT